MASRSRTPAAPPPALNADLIYVNGIDPDTGKYAVPPVSIDDVARNVRSHPGGEKVTGMHDQATRFAPPFGVDLEKLAEAGWGVVFHEDTPPAIRAALKPLIDCRRKQAGDLLKVLDYKKGEQVGDWYRRHQVAPSVLEPALVPYYLLLVGPPTGIPFEFEYLLGVGYAVGRLAFEKPEEYERYALSIVEYEKARTPRNAREIVYWGTRHPADPATNLSASFLIEPLANGLPGEKGTVKRPIHEEVGYAKQLHLGDDATKQALLDALAAKKPPALLFTASHGMALRAGQPKQCTDQGSLLCQDWPGYGSVQAKHCLAAADVTDDANVKGMVAILFACFGAGTPDADQFLMDLGQAGTAPPLAPQPFIAALPQRLLAHPKGSALAVIGHIDRAWGFSIQPAKTTGAQIGAFRNSLGFILSGSPVGHAVALQFGQRFATLSTGLLSAVSPTAPASMRPSDRELVSSWLERNDAQNYVLLGDPAVRIRKDLKA